MHIIYSVLITDVNFLTCVGYIEPLTNVRCITVIDCCYQCFTFGKKNQVIFSFFHFQAISVSAFLFSSVIFCSWHES